LDSLPIKGPTPDTLRYAPLGQFGKIRQPKTVMSGASDSLGGTETAQLTITIYRRRLSNRAGGNNESCTIINTQLRVLTVNKVVVPIEAVGAFNLYVTDATVLTLASVSNVGSGGTTGPVLLSPGTFAVGETASAGTDMVGYARSIDCGSGPVA